MNEKYFLIILLLCLDYSIIIFLLGFMGLLLNRRNLLLMLLSLELTFLSSSLNFFFSSYLLNYINGAIYGIFVILVVVADTAIGLSLVVISYRSSKLASINSLITLRA